MISEEDFNLLSNKEKYIICTRGQHQCLDDMIGAGYLDHLITQGFTPAVKDIIAKYGNDTITKLSIVRTPLSGVLSGALNVASLGSFDKTKKRNNYNDYFHLHLNIGLSSGASLTYEKTEVIVISKNTTRAKGSEVLDIANVPNVTLNTFIENTKRVQGSKFYNYNASSNNCQYFIKDALLGNGVNGQNYIDFVKQDTESLFKNRPIFRKVANSATDLGASVQTIKTALTPPLSLPSLNMPSMPSGKSVQKKIKKFFGGGDECAVASATESLCSKVNHNYKKMSVKDLKVCIKSHKKATKAKDIKITGLKKKELVSILESL